MLLIIMVIAAGVAYIVYQKYVNPTGNQPATTTTDPVYPSKTPKPLPSPSSNVKASESSSKFGKSSLAKSPLLGQSSSPVKKSRTPRPIQVITLGIGGDDLAPGVVKEAETPIAPAPVAAAPVSDLNNNVSAPEPEKPKIEEAPKPSTPLPAVVTPPPAPEAEKPKETSAPETKKQEPSDSTQDSSADKGNTLPAPGVTADVQTARSPAPPAEPQAQEGPLVGTAALVPTPAAEEQPKSEDIKTAKIINENSLKEKRGETESPGPSSGQSPAPPANESSGREKAPEGDNEVNTSSSQSAPPGLVDPSALGVGGADAKDKKKKKKKSKGSKGKKKSKDGKSADGEKKKKKKSKKSGEKKKKSKKSAAPGAPEEKKSEEDGPPPAPGV
jgi:hypothetical protein